MVEVVLEAIRERGGRNARALVVSALGPMTIVAGLAWVAAQPYRVTLLEPRGQGFWWLFVQPPLLVVLVGLVFHLLIRPGVIEDLQAEEEGR